MVKDSKLPKVTGLPRPYDRGAPRKPGRTKDARLMIRVHPDVEELLKNRKDDTGDNLSRYIEKILIGWLRADPRNRRIDANGVLVPGAPTPNEMKTRDTMRFAQQWQSFSNAYAAVHGSPPPQHWLDDMGPDYLQEGDDNPPLPMPPAVKAMVDRSKAKKR